MRDISNRFKNEQDNDNRNYLKYADITLTDGTIINLTNADFWSNGMKFEDSVSDDNVFKIGSANINTLNLSINNFDGKYTDYDFTDATVICYVGIELEPEDTSALLDTTGDKILDTTGNEIIVHKNALIEKIRICTMTVIDTPYISFNAAKGGTLALGGQNDGNGLVKIYDSSGSLILTIGQNGIETRATTLTNKNAKGKIVFNKKGLTFVQDIAGGGTSSGNDLHLEKSIISFGSLANVIGELDKLTVRGDAKAEGRLLFYDYENQSKKASEAVTRQPVASITANTNRVAYLMSDYHANGYGVGSEHANHRLGVKAQWGGSAYTMYYIYTNTTTSDIRLKDNIKNSETDALETVNRMKVRQFDWKERMGGWHQDIGFVADELEEIDPNLALGGGYDENGEMDIKQINSPYLLNYAIKAIQELSAKVDEQEKRIKELERRLQNGKI